MGYVDVRDVRVVPAVTGAAPARLPGPFDLPTPAGAEGWQELYSYCLPFSEDRRPYEESVFWFRDAIHWPRPIRPFEAAFVQDAMISLGQFNHRVFVMPAARGLDLRVLHGYCYLSPGCIDDPATVAARSAMFAERAGFYYEHWDKLYAGWMDRIRELLGRLGDISFPDLPEVVPIEEVTGGRGAGRVHHLTRRYHELLDLGVELWQCHFEFLNLGYAAYLDFFQLCQAVLPKFSDLEVARMVAGIDVELFRPDHELRRLAHAAVELGLDESAFSGSPTEVLATLATVPGGSQWLDDFTNIQDPWFNYSTGPGFYCDDAVWADHLEVPLEFIRSYVALLRTGQSIDTDVAQVARERDQLAEQARGLLTGLDRELFDSKLRLARTVFHFVENHNFYIEHWGMSVIWRKLRELSSRFVQAGFWDSIDDVFLLRPDEVETALTDLLGSWAIGAPARGPQHWPGEVRRREGILAACASWTPPPALGTAPPVVTEPFTIMLWGITSASLDRWKQGQPSSTSLSGLAASSGVAVGRARVVLCVDDLDALEAGEILVTELTSPSWAPVFAHIGATVTECGGLMSHAAIVCREYRLPAVTSVVGATQQIRTGQLLRVDGSAGTVTILDADLDAGSEG